MEKTIIDERSGWEYELIGEQYYPTGEVIRNGVLIPSEPPNDNGPEEEKQSAFGVSGICDTFGNIINGCILICI